MEWNGSKCEKLNISRTKHEFSIKKLNFLNFVSKTTYCIFKSYHLLVGVTVKSLFGKTDSVDFVEKPSTDPKMFILNQIGAEI